MRGGEHSFAAQASLQVDAEIAKNSRFQTETNNKIILARFTKKFQKKTLAPPMRGKGYPPPRPFAAVPREP